MQIFRRLWQGPASTELALGVRSVAAEDGEKAEQPDGAIDDPDRLAEERLCGAYTTAYGTFATLPTDTTCLASHQLQCVSPMRPARRHHITIQCSRADMTTAHDSWIVLTAIPFALRRVASFVYLNLTMSAVRPLRLSS